jgi:hypothetical protein
MMITDVFSIKRFRPAFTLALSGLLFLGCASAPQQPNPQASCTVNFFNHSPQSLCTWFHDGFGSFGRSCGSRISAELERQGRTVFPRASCGQLKIANSASDCRMKYANSSTQIMCDAYHGNRDLVCDSSIRDIFRERNLNLHPRQVCGTQMQSAAGSTAPVCRRGVANESTTRLCTLYWENQDTACDSQMRSEIIRRTGSIGTNKDSCIQREISSSIQACSGHTLGQLTNAPPLQLCSISAGKSDCSRIAEALLVGRGLKASQSCGEASQDECSSLVRSLAMRHDGTTEACRIRNDKTQLIGVKCRRSLNGFLLEKQVSPGSASNSCGQPIKAGDLTPFRANR